MPRFSHAMQCIAACAVFAGANAYSDTGKLLLTGGVSSIDGAAGGGISPWALVGTQATQGEWGASAYATRLRTQDYALSGAGAALAWAAASGAVARGVGLALVLAALALGVRQWMAWIT